MRAWSLIGLLLVAASLTGTASAQATRTWVSGTGDDEDSCGRFTPCATFAAALANTLAGGEIDVLDPAGPGTVTITKSVTLNGEGTIASILFAGSTGITVNAPGGHVIIRNISFLGGGSGVTGVKVVSAASVTLENCVISGFTSMGVSVESSAAVTLVVRNTSIAGGSVGIRIAGTGDALANIHNLSVSGAEYGVRVTNNNGVATIEGSRFHANTMVAVSTLGTGIASVVDSLLSNNAVAFDARGQSTVRISGNAIFDNGKAYVRQGGGTIATAGDNRAAGNGGGLAPLNGALQVQ